MKTIVAATDFSTISLNAVNYAADMACVTGAGLSVIHVCPIPIVLGDLPSPVYSIDQLFTDAEQQMGKLKNDLTYRVGDQIKINTIIMQGDVITQIDEYCSTVNAYAVIVGAENAGAFERFLFGGKTIAAVKHLSWPLIVVPPEAKFSNIRKIGLACDFKKVVDTIPANEIKSIVEAFHAELHILHVSPKGYNSYSAETVEESRWIQLILEKMKPIYHFIDDTDVEKGINEFAQKNDLDLLIVVPKKHNILGKIFKHSLSNQLVLHTHVPMMVIHE